jgi:hypothetical protein
MWPPWQSCEVLGTAPPLLVIRDLSFVVGVGDMVGGRFSLIAGRDSELDIKGCEAHDCYLFHSNQSQPPLSSPSLFHNETIAL